MMPEETDGQMLEAVLSSMQPLPAGMIKCNDWNYVAWFAESLAHSYDIIARRRNRDGSFDDLHFTDASIIAEDMRGGDWSERIDCVMGFFTLHYAPQNGIYQYRFYVAAVGVAEEYERLKDIVTRAAGEEENLVTPFGKKSLRYVKLVGRNSGVIQFLEGLPKNRTLVSQFENVDYDRLRKLVAGGD